MEKRNGNETLGKRTQDIQISENAGLELLTGGFIATHSAHRTMKQSGEVRKHTRDLKDMRQCGKEKWKVGLDCIDLVKHRVQCQSITGHNAQKLTKDNQVKHMVECQSLTRQNAQTLTKDNLVKHRVQCQSLTGHNAQTLTKDNLMRHRVTDANSAHRPGGRNWSCVLGIVRLKW